MALGAVLGYGIPAVMGLLQGRKKEKGVQKQFVENLGFVGNQGGMHQALQAYLASITAGAGQQGNLLASQLQGVLGRTGAGATGAGAAAKGIGRSYAGNQAMIGRGQALFQGQMGINQLAAGLATGAGAAQPAGPTAFQTFLTNLGQYMLTRQGQPGQGQQPNGTTGPWTGGVGRTPGMNFPGLGQQPSYDAMRNMQYNPNFQQNQKFGRKP